MKKVIFVLSSFLALSPCVMAKSPSGHSNGILKVSVKGNITVKGKVTDEQGNPLPGASVYAKGTTTGTITDMDGNYTLTVPDDAVLEFSFIGYITQEYSVNGNTNIPTIKLVEDNKELEQVVVIGYGTQKKVDLTGSVAIVDADEMKKVSNSNISTMLEGKVAGVQITSDGQPGADPSVRIRGIGSFGDTAPLYVVDGVPVGTSIRDFSPNDIASIQILKDASAAAIYGSRAANGVVIITTKSGKQNQPLKVDYSGYFGIDWVNKNVYDVMGTEDFTKYIQTAYGNVDEPLPSGYDPTSPNYFLNSENYVNTDWFDEVFKLGTRQNHNVNLSGGSDKSTYNVGIDYFDQKGVVEGSGPDFKRYTVRVNNTMDVKFIKLKTGIVYSHSDQNSMSISNANEYIQGLSGDYGNLMASILTMQPTIKAYDESTWVLDGVDGLGAASAYPYDAYGFGVYNANLHGEIAQSNPLILNNIIERKNQVDRILATATASVDLFDMVGKKFKNHNLSYNINLSYNKTYCKDFVWVPTWYQSAKINFSEDATRLNQGYRQYTTGLIENTINYNGTFANKHHVSAVVGQTFESEYYHTLAAWATGYVAPYYLQISQGANRDASSYEDEHTLASYIGRLNYDFDQKYLISATVRRDGSSRLSSDDRWGWFPSVSLGWRLDREAFFPVDDRLINLLKFRGSYGILGNENIGNYQYMSTMATNNFAYSFGGNIVYGSAISSFVNNSIAWEKKKSTSVGMDLGMFNGQLEFTFEWYKNVSEDLLYGVPVPVTTGVSNGTVTMNAAEMENSGFEWSATYHNYKHQIKYDISLNASTLKNKVVSLGFGNDYYLDGDYMTYLGEELGQFYGYRYLGIIETQEQLDAWNAYAVEKGQKEYQPGARVGDCLYEDLNGDGVITTDDREVIESGMPKVSFGLSGRAEYKGWDLSVSTFGALGYHVYDYIYNNQLTSCYGIGNKDPEVLNGTPNVYFSNTAAGQTLAWNDLMSERKIQNANYWKIANVELGYNFKDAWFGGVVTNVRAYVSAQNIATITKYKGYNVDYAAGTFTPGYNYCSFPSPKTVMFGLQCTF